MKHFAKTALSINLIPVYLFTLVAILSLPLVAICQEFIFNPPFKLQHAYGETLSIKTLTIDEDINGEKIYIYITTEGQEGFVTKGRIINFDTLLDALYPSRVGKRKKEQKPASTTHTSQPNSSSSNYKSGSSSAINPGVAVQLINSFYGNVCEAKLKGFFSKTLVIDWTRQTRVIHSVKVLAEIGKMKEQLYHGGVRYLQFPNDAGTYNVIDWKTGQKKSISAKAQYYFD